MNVYWSPFFTKEVYPSVQLLYEEPQSLLDTIKQARNKSNKSDNFYSCHAFLETVKNTFVLQTPYDLAFCIDDEIGIIPVNGKYVTKPFLQLKQPSQIDAYTFAVRCNWIFWSDEPLIMSTTPPYLHKNNLQGFYVPGSFDVNKWFRPIEGAIQLYSGVNSVRFSAGDPLAYVKFHTNKSVNLKRFYLTPEIEELSWGCVEYKQHKPTKRLESLYNVFSKSGAGNRISKLIKQNVVN